MTMKLKHIALLALFAFCAATINAQENTPAAPPPPQTASALTPPPPPPLPPKGAIRPDEHKPHPDDSHNNGWRPSAEMRKFFQDLKKNNPEEYKRLMKLRMQDREKFSREVFRSMPRPTRESEQRIEELDKKCWELAKKLQNSSDETEKAAIKEELEKASAESLDLLIQQTEQQIAELNKRLQSFQENRDKILEKKINFFLHLQPQPPQKK